MRRLFLLISITTAALFSSYDLKAEAPERQGWEKDFSLYGDVESVVMTEYKLEDKFGEVVRGDILYCRKYYFNDAGDVIEDARYDSYGSLGDKDICKYDSSGNMIEETKYRSEALIPESLIVYEITYRN